MKKYLLAIILSWLTVTVVSCSYHFYTKKEAIKVAKKRDLKGNGSIIIEDDNRVLKVLTRDSNYQNLDEIYHFSDDGKQHKYTVVASCDSCFQKFLLLEINNRGYSWKKLNDSTYISKYRRKRFLNIHRTTFSFDIVRHDQSRREYENLIKNVEK